MKNKLTCAAGLIVLLAFAPARAAQSFVGPEQADQTRDPNDIETLLEDGMQKSSRGDYAAALVDFDRAIATNPDNPKALVFRGFARLSSGDQPGALADCNRALVLDPSCEPAYLLRGNVQVARGERAGAIADFDKVILLNPDNPFAFVGRAEAKRAGGDTAGAIADTQRALELNPYLQNAYASSARAKQEAGDLDAAIADFDRLLARSPTDTAAWYNRGHLKLEKGDLVGARADFIQAIAVFPTNSFAYRGLGTLNEILGDFAGAQKAYAKAIEVEPWRAQYVRFFLTLVLRRQHLDETPAGLSAAISGWTDQWTKTIGSFLLGRTTEEQLFRLAERGGARTVRGQRCEAYYYAGMVRLLANNTSKAGEYFRKCVDTRITSFGEYQLAKTELTRLAWPSGLGTTGAISGGPALATANPSGAQVPDIAEIAPPEGVAITAQLHEQGRITARNLQIGMMPKEVERILGKFDSFAWPQLKLLQQKCRKGPCTMEVEVRVGAVNVCFAASPDHKVRVKTIQVLAVNQPSAR